MCFSNTREWGETQLERVLRFLGLGFDIEKEYRYSNIEKGRGDLLTDRFGVTSTVEVRGVIFK